MKAYAAIILVTIGFMSATAQQQLQPVPVSVAPPVTATEQQQVQQTNVAAQPQQTQPAEPSQPQHIVLRVVGSQVRNQTGERLGLIEEMFVHRTSGAAEYAIVSSAYPTNSSRQVPVPWGALTYVWDQSRAGGPSGANQVFILNMDARLLAQAPAIDRSRPSTLDATLTNARNFFGVPQAVGATGTPATGVTGAAAGQTGAAATPATGGLSVNRSTTRWLFQANAPQSSPVAMLRKRPISAFHTSTITRPGPATSLPRGPPGEGRDQQVEVREEEPRAEVQLAGNERGRESNSPGLVLSVEYSKRGSIRTRTFLRPAISRTVPALLPWSMSRARAGPRRVFARSCDGAR